MTETKARPTDDFREIADKGIAQANANFDKAKAATDEGTDLFKNSYATAAKGATDYNLKFIEIARANTNTAFDYAHAMLAVKSVPEFFELSTAHARKHFETMTVQTQGARDARSEDDDGYRRASQDRCCQGIQQ